MAGEKATIKVRVKRTGRRDPVHLEIQGLPAKIRAKIPVIGHDQDEGQMELIADEDVEAVEKTIKVEGSMGKLDDVARVRLTVEQAGWFDLRPIPPFTLRPGQSQTKRIQVDRKWYKGPIKFQVENLPRGVTAEWVTIAGDKNSAEITFLADANAVMEAKEPVIRAGGVGLRKQHLVKALKVNFWLSRQVRKIKVATAMDPPVAISPDGRRALSIQNRTGLFLWDLEKEDSLLLHEKTKDPNTWTGCFAFSPDSSYAFAGGTWGIKYWNTGKPEGKDLQVKNQVDRLSKLLAISPDGARLIWHNIWAQVLSCNLKNSTAETLDLRFAGHEYSCLAYGSFILAGGQDTLQMRRPNGQEVPGLAKPEQSLSKHPGKVTCLTFFPDGEKNLSGAEDGNIWIWDWKIGDEGREREAKKLAQHEPGGKVLSLATSRNGERVLSGSADKTLRLWDLSGRELARIDHPAEVRTVGFGPGENQVISYCGHGFIRVWQLPK
jgi:WD40 repeat protein